VGGDEAADVNGDHPERGRIVGPAVPGVPAVFLKPPDQRSRGLAGTAVGVVEELVGELFGLRLE
jgi:hypothetical protein